MKGILVCACYRPPNDNDFISRLEQALVKVEPGKEIYILGDVNINVGQSSSVVSRYLDMLSLFNCHQVISEPTRVTPTCSTTLDHAIVNNRGLVQQCGVIDCGFSDHLVTFCSRGLPRNFSVGSTVRKIRSLKSYSAIFSRQNCLR